MKPLHQIQEDRETCEVPFCSVKKMEKLDRGFGFGVGLDWDHCIFEKNNKKSHPEFAKFVNGHFNMIRACSVCNRITHLSDHWNTKKWLIDYHMDSEYRHDFLEWIDTWPDKLHPTDEYVIDTYITRRRKE